MNPIHDNEGRRDDEHPLTSISSAIAVEFIRRRLESGIPLTFASEPSPRDVAHERALARDELVKAALRLYQAEREAGSYPATAYRPWQQAEAALYEACKTFLAMGGSEVEGR